MQRAAKKMGGCLKNLASLKVNGTAALEAAAKSKEVTS
jgi:hypothetical protein